MDPLERRDDVSEERLLNAVTWVAREAQNSTGLNAGQPTAKIQQRYFEWAGEAERQLNSVLTDAATTVLIRTDGFWWLQSAPADSPNLIRIVNGEYERVARLLNAWISDRSTTLELETNVTTPQMSTADRRKVFVVHGRNLAARNAMFDYLRALGLTPIEWSSAVAMTGQGSPYTGDVLDKALSTAQAIVVLLTPDDIAYLRPEYTSDPHDADLTPTAQARPNVLFEAGMAMGRSAARTVIVELGALRAFSDVAGRHVIRMSNQPERRQELRARLITAGCEVDEHGTDWLSTSGDFTPPPPPGQGLPIGKRLPTSTAPPGVKIDAKFHDRSNGAGRLELINRGQVDVLDISIEIPEEGAGFQFLTAAFPIAKLPASKSLMLPCHTDNTFGGRHNDYFDIIVTGHTPDRQSVREKLFISLVG